MAKKDVRRCSAALVARKAQIETRMRRHLTPPRMAVAEKPDKNEFRQGCGESGPLVRRCWEFQMGQLLWDRVWQFLNVNA